MIYRYNVGRGWQSISGGGVQISVDALGNPWVVNDRGAVWRYATATGQWQEMRPGGSATAIAASTGVRAAPVPDTQGDLTLCPPTLGPGDF
jgi:hypothetical protein